MTARTEVTERLAAILIAVVAALAVVPVKSWLNDIAGVDIGFIPALAAVVVAAWLGGFLPGVIATALGIVVEATVFMEPLGLLVVDGERIRLVLFGLTGVLASWLAWLRTSAEAQARAATLAATAARDRADVVARRLGALEALAEELAGAATTDLIVDLVLPRAIAALRADGGAIFLLEPGDDELVAVAWHGYDETRASSLQRLPLAIPMPATDVVRTGEPVFIEDPDEYVARYREPLEARGLSVERRAVAVVPLEVGGRQFGAVGFTWNGPHDLPADRRAFVAAIARLAAAAMDRARLFDAERRRAAELEAVVAAIGEAILVAEPDGTIRASNATAARLLGGGSQSVEGFLASLLDADGDPPRRLPSGPSEYRLTRRPTSWVEVTSYPVTATGDEGRGARVIVCRDVSAFRQGQALREAFLGLLSHELRTPVTTIYGGASVLVRSDGNLAPATRAEILADVASEADRLYRLVEDLLVLARFDEGIQVGDEPALLQRLVPLVVDQERTRWPTVDFAVEVAAHLPAVRGDETSITQVLRNLISNAAKYGDARGGVTVVVEATADGVAVHVRDDGPGINPLEAEDIFDPFYRSASTAKMAGGAGIGLYVSRRLVEAMRGRIWAAARATGGSEFSFVLPRYGDDVDELPDEAGEAAGGLAPAAR